MPKYEVILTKSKDNTTLVNDMTEGDPVEAASVLEAIDKANRDRGFTPFDGEEYRVYEHPAPPRPIQHTVRIVRRAEPIPRP